MEMENPESVKKAVQRGLGIAFISKFDVETELKAKNLVAVRARGVEGNESVNIPNQRTNTKVLPDTFV